MLHRRCIVPIIQMLRPHCVAINVKNPSVPSVHSSHPTGYRCKECIKGQQKIFETALFLDYPIIFVVVALLAYLGSLIALRLGFFIILLAPIVGGVIAEVARLVTRRRRSKRLYILAAVAAVVGCIPLTLQIILQFSLLGLIWHAAYAVLMTSALYTRLAGIKIG